MATPERLLEPILDLFSLDKGWCKAGIPESVYPKYHSCVPEGPISYFNVDAESAELLQEFRLQVASEVSGCPFVQEMWRDGTIVAIARADSVEIFVTNTGSTYRCLKDGSGTFKFEHLSESWWRWSHKHWDNAVKRYAKQLDLGMVAMACIRAKVAELPAWKSLRKPMTHDERLHCIWKGCSLVQECIRHRGDESCGEDSEEWDMLVAVWIYEAFRIKGLSNERISRIADMYEQMEDAGYASSD